MHARSRPLVTISQAPDTTSPLSSWEGSQLGKCQPSIVIACLRALLQTASAGATSSSDHTCACGHGHCRRACQLSRSSAIGTFHEKTQGCQAFHRQDTVSIGTVFRVRQVLPSSLRESDLSANPSIDIIEWDAEQMVMGLQRYYALRNEADDTISSPCPPRHSPLSSHSHQSHVISPSLRIISFI
jgi:serine/arginine repetitive matrix protein 2